nr:hypothetical protein [Campylobacter jejuni]
MAKFTEMSKDLIKHYGLDNVANETEINALAYALQDCCAMYNEKNELSFTDEQINDFKHLIVDNYVKGDNEPNNEQSVEDIVYSLHYSMLLNSVPEEIVDNIGRDLFIDKVEMGIDDRYQVSFLCNDAESFLKRIKEHIMLDNELNEYTKFCLENTDNFYEIDSLEDIFITEDIFDVKKHIENAPSNEVQNKELALKICSDLVNYSDFYENAYLKICLEDIKKIKNIQNTEDKEYFLKELLNMRDNEFEIFQEAIENYNIEIPKDCKSLWSEIYDTIKDGREKNSDLIFIDSFFENDEDRFYSGNINSDERGISVYISSIPNQDEYVEDDDILKVLDKDFDFKKYQYRDIKWKAISIILANQIFKEIENVKNNIENTQEQNNKINKKY